MDGDYSHEIRTFALWKKCRGRPRSRDITLPTKVWIVNAVVFPGVMHRGERWTMEKAERLTAVQRLCCVLSCNKLESQTLSSELPWTFFSKQSRRLSNWSHQCIIYLIRRHIWLCRAKIVTIFFGSVYSVYRYIGNVTVSAKAESVTKKYTGQKFPFYLNSPSFKIMTPWI